MNILFLSIFWMGILLLQSRDKWDLKKRSMFYLGQISAMTQTSELCKIWRRIKASGKKEKMLAELIQSLAYVKNITILGRGKNISAVLLLEEMADLFPALSNVYLDMAGYLTLNEKQRASEVLYLEMGTSYSQDIGNFLSGWESIPQEELMGSIETYLQALRLEKMTAVQKRDEMVSDLIYFPVVINCMAVLLNFIYVAYFIEQKEALMGLF